MARLYHLLALLAIPVLLAGSGAVGYLAYAGRLNAATLDAVAGALRGAAPRDARAAGPISTTQPAGEDYADGSAGASAEALRVARRTERLGRAVAERAAADLAARQALLDQSLQSLLSLQEDFARKQTEAAEAQMRQSGAGHDEGFAREVEYVAKLSPKLAKEHVLRTFQSSQADAVRLLMALQPAQGQRILEQFKTPDEIEVMHNLLEQIRTQEAPSIPASGTSEDGPEESPWLTEPV
jgi:hypothetical protein